MKVIKEQQIISATIVDDENEGFMALIGQQVTCFCAIYIYTGKLVGVNKTCIKLEAPKIVYETGSFDTEVWKDAQALPNDMYIQLGMIEAFGVLK